MTTAAFLGANFLLLLTALTPALTACCAIGSCKLCGDDSLTSKVAADVTYSGAMHDRYGTGRRSRYEIASHKRFNITYFRFNRINLRMRAAALELEGGENTPVMQSD